MYSPRTASFPVDRKQKPAYRIEYAYFPTPIIINGDPVFENEYLTDIP